MLYMFIRFTVYRKNQKPYHGPYPRSITVNGWYKPSSAGLLLGSTHYVSCMKMTQPGPWTQCPAAASLSGSVKPMGQWLHRLLVQSLCLKFIDRRVGSNARFYVSICLVSLDHTIVKYLFFCRSAWRDFCRRSHVMWDHIVKRASDECAGPGRRSRRIRWIRWAVID